MAYLSAHGTMKPPLGARMDPDHPFAQNSLLCVPFIGGIGQPPQAPGVIPVPVIFPPTGIVGTAKPPQHIDYVAGAPTWTSNREGWAGHCALSTGASDDGWRLSSSNAWLPTAQATVLLIRQKLDTTNRGAAVIQAAHGTTSFNIHAPYSDGNAYWDFGGTSAPNRLSGALAYSTNSPDRMIFTAGPRGSTIWLNGVKIASQSTAISRMVDNNEAFINRYYTGAAGTGDYCNYNFFQIINDQWSDEMCRWWSAEPYDHLYAPPMTYRDNAALMAAASGASGGGGSSGSSRLGLIGVG